MPAMMIPRLAMGNPQEASYGWKGVDDKVGVGWRNACGEMPCGMGADQRIGKTVGGAHPTGIVRIVRRAAALHGAGDDEFGHGVEDLAGFGGGEVGEDL